MLAYTDWAVRVQCNGTSHSCFLPPLHEYLPDCQACQVSSMPKTAQCMVRTDSKNWRSPPDIALLLFTSSRERDWRLLRRIWKKKKACKLQDWRPSQAWQLQLLDGGQGGALSQLSSQIWELLGLEEEFQVETIWMCVRLSEVELCWKKTNDFL